jgi:hypothetical protein
LYPNRNSCSYNTLCNSKPLLRLSAVSTLEPQGKLVPVAPSSLRIPHSGSGCDRPFSAYFPRPSFSLILLRLSTPPLLSPKFTTGLLL